MSVVNSYETIYQNYKKIHFYIRHFPDKIEFSCGNIINITDDFEIIHQISTEKGSSGSPILVLEDKENELNNLKVFGVHKGASERSKENYGSQLKNAIELFREKFINEIRIKIKIEENDLNKDIYILNNPYLRNEDDKSYKIEELKEINSSNITMSINGKESKFEKYQKFEKEGEYYIILKFKNNLTNAKYMFNGCTNIIDINLSSFITEDITCMYGMFQECINLESLDLLSFETQKVTDIGCMFYNCKNLTSINLSSLDTKNVINMNELFHN